MKLNPDIIFRQEFDGTGLLFDPNNGSSFFLNQASVQICQCLEKDMELNEILDTLKAKFANVPDSLQKDVLDFIEQLNQHNCILTRI